MRKQKQRLLWRALFANRDLWLLGIERELLIKPHRRAAKRAYLDALQRIDFGAQFLGSQIKLIRPESEIISGIILGETICQSLKGVGEIVFDGDRFIDYQYGIF